MSDIPDTESTRKRKKIKLSNDSNQEGNLMSSSIISTVGNEKKPTTSEDDKNEETTDFSSLVAAHYNSAEQANVKHRNDSRIVHLRNFNNWIKSILIKESVWQLPEQNRVNLNILDMCCGKGGDLLKWTKLNVRYIICADIAENSLEQYKVRFHDYKKLCEINGKHCASECEFIPADCTKTRLRGKFRDPSIRFDVVSCQFSFHYCFESLPQAECMLKNASECLKPGGVFIGTIPNANEIVKRLKKSKTNSFKNEVFAVEMICEEPYPLFGAKYNFYLEGVVNCPEFLVHFPTFEKLAMKNGLKLVERENFIDYFERKSKTREGEILLKRMKALEAYPPEENKKSVGPSEDYIHAKIYCEQNNEEIVGTLSKSEWEVVSLYQMFTFKKVESR